MAEHEARWAEVVIIYEGKNISKDIAPYLLNFTYTDNAADKADDISFSLEDRDRLWTDDWFPTKGDKVTVSIAVHDWDAPDKTESLPCGTFEVDEISVSGAPNTVTIKAISTLISKPMGRRSTQRHGRMSSSRQLPLILRIKTGSNYFGTVLTIRFLNAVIRWKFQTLNFCRGLRKITG